MFQSTATSAPPPPRVWNKTLSQRQGPSTSPVRATMLADGPENVFSGRWRPPGSPLTSAEGLEASAEGLAGLFYEGIVAVHDKLATYVARPGSIA